MKDDFTDNYKGQIFRDLAPHHLGVLKYEEILHYYDGPVAFFASDNNGLNFFSVWHDSDDKQTGHRIWLLLLIPKYIVLGFRYGIASMLDIYNNSIEKWFITDSDIGSCAIVHNIKPDDDFELDNITFEAWREWFYTV